MKTAKFLVCVLALALYAGVARADITTGLIGHWQMDDGGGATAVDSAGSNDGTLVTPDNPQFVAGGRFGGAIDFAGGNTPDSLVEVADDISLDLTGSRTISTWLRLDAWGANWTGAITKGDIAGNYDLIRDGSSDNIGFYIADQDFVVGDDNVADGAWHLLTGVYDDAGTMSMYVDGVLDASAAVTGGATATNDQPLVFNGLNDGNTGWDNTRHNDGQMDDIRLYDRALSAADVLELFNVSPGILGDVNDDTLVNLTDFEIIRSNFFGIDVGRSLGDLNVDGVVDLEDFGEWKDHYDGNGGAMLGLLLGVPEPGSAGLAAIGILIMGVIRRRSRQVA